MATTSVQSLPEDIDFEPDVGDELDERETYPIDQYDLVSAPNDFNTRTLVDFIDQGVVTIPGFQRNFVWDIKRASRLIESIIVGLPVPQIFLYEQGRNKHLVIDGQQRLMSIYYFVKQRFPRKEKLAELRKRSDEKSVVPDEILADNEYFIDFRLNLPESVPGQANRYNRLKYDGLEEEHRSAFNLRTIRNIIVRQVGPSGDQAMYEVFNRLNSGGTNLTPQEIRRCAFDSVFYDMLYEANARDDWRKLVGTTVPDIHSKDVEVLLRGFAMLLSEGDYRPSMVRFLNGFSQDAKHFDRGEVNRLKRLLTAFINACKGLGSTTFHSTANRFSPMVFESVFVAACEGANRRGDESIGSVDASSVEELKADSEFSAATQGGTTSRENVKLRLDKARAIIKLSS